MAVVVVVVRRESRRQVTGSRAIRAGTTDEFDGPREWKSEDESRI